MSRKDYIKFAALISKIKEDNIRLVIALGIANICCEDNPKFDWDRFMKACQNGS